jgi:phage baseplate assembly protein gpV
VIEGAAATARQDADDVHGLDTSAFGDVGTRILFNRLASDSTEAQALSQADMDRSAARDVIIEATAMGSPEIRPGRIVNVQGVSDNIDGRYTVTVAEHTITEAAGYLTAFSTEPPRIRRVAGPCPAFTFGTVTDVNDPERLSRVRVKLLLLGDLDSAWMPVVIPGAGVEKGLAILPEVDDEVLIVFPQGDPAYGIVLGGLYGKRKAPGLVDSGTRPFAFRTGNGQAITLDAEKGLARIETSGGDVVELGPDGSKIHAKRDLVIEAPGRKLTIRANAIEFERG